MALDYQTKGDQEPKAYICFDANLPTLERCQENCQNKEGVLCLHRFNTKVEVEYCNTKKFQKTMGADKGWSDLRIFLYFLGNILIKIAEGRVDPDKCAFIILTRDQDFIEDIKSEVDALKKHSRFWYNLDFSGSSISWNNIDIFIVRVDCQNYGHGRTEDLKCSFLKVNQFLKEYASF